MAAGLQVFGQPASTDVARVLTCLFEKNLEFELVRIDTFKKSHKLPEFIKLRVYMPFNFDPSIQFLLVFVQESASSDFKLFSLPSTRIQLGK
jgi:glutaredoxin-related protein